MSLELLTDGTCVINSLVLKYASTKTDKFNNTCNFYVIKDNTFDEMIKELPSDSKFPWFKGKKDYLIKVKSKYLKDEPIEKVGGKATIKLTDYSIENIDGFYVSEIEFK